VIAADVYSVPPHTGRGGWTWYTGSSGWMYRLGIEALLGLQRQGSFLLIDPCIPSSWRSYQLCYRWGQAVLNIQVENPDGVSRGLRRVEMGGRLLPDGKIPLPEDPGEYDVRVILGEPDSEE
jgi:cellobiose phosphorylase